MLSLLAIAAIVIGVTLYLPFALNSRVRLMPWLNVQPVTAFEAISAVGGIVLLFSGFVTLFVRLIQI